MHNKIPRGIKNDAYKRWGKVCKHCGWKPRDGKVDGEKRILSLHHLDSDPHNNCVSNLMPLCNGKDSCHQFAEEILGHHRKGCGKCSTK